MNLDPNAYKTPGQYIEALMDQRGWKQATMSIMLDIDKATLNRIIQAKRAVSANLALELSEVFEVPAENFLELQKSYDLAQARLIAMPDPARANRAHLFGSLPISDMIKRGWLAGIEDTKNIPQVETALAKFFKADSITEIETLPHAAKRTVVSEGATPAQLAWLYRVKEVASELLVSKYTPNALRQAIGSLKELLVSSAAIRKVPRVLAECGVRFVIVESLPGAKIDGVCFWLDDNSPVIGMTLRYDRIDNFWFVLRHELEHVLLGHGKNAVILDAELEGERAGVGDSVTEEERLANQAAAEFCVPKKSLDSFIARKSPLFREKDIIGFSNVLKVHPGLVAGQLQRRINRYDLFRAHLVKVRDTIVPNAVVDGWGDIAPVGP